MAQLFSSYIYGVEGPGGLTSISAAGGQLNAFSPVGCHIYPTTSVQGNAQVTCNSVIEIPPTGTNSISRKFYTADTVATLVTAANT